MTECPNCRSVAPESLYCPTCGYPLLYIKQGKESNYVERRSTVQSMAYRSEPIHRIYSTMKCDEKWNVEMSAAEEVKIKKRSEKIHEDKYTRSDLKDNDLGWIRLLNRLNINDEEVKVIEEEWIQLIRQLRKISRIL